MGDFTVYGAVYRWLTTPKTWQAAQEQCASYSMSLPTIYSAEHNALLNTEVRKFISANLSYWIGFNDVLTEVSGAFLKCLGNCAALTLTFLWEPLNAGHMGVG